MYVRMYLSLYFELFVEGRCKLVHTVLFLAISATFGFPEYCFVCIAQIYEGNN